MVKNNIFNSFQEFWNLTKNLENYQRDIIFNSLSHEQKLSIRKSYQRGGWEDLLIRNALYKAVEEIKENKDLGYDLISIRVNAIQGKCFYIKKEHWTKIFEKITNVARKKKHLDYVFGGLKIEEDVGCVCIIKKR